jgi:hypothetical protein
LPYCVVLIVVYMRRAYGSHVFVISFQRTEVRCYNIKSRLRLCNTPVNLLAIE